MRSTPPKSVKFHKSILSILALYLGTSIVLLGVICFVMYHKGLQNLKANQMAQMRDDSIKIAAIIYEQKGIENAIDELESAINTPFAIVDSSGGVVFSTIAFDIGAIINALKTQRPARFGEQFFIDHRFLRHIPPPSQKFPKKIFHYVDSLHIRIILQGYNIDDSFPLLAPKPIEQLSLAAIDVPKEVRKLKVEIWLYFACAIVLMGIIAYYLTRLALAPIREKIQTLERFIKDSTHEINTPLSVILMSVQSFDTKNLSASNLTKLQHIKLSAQNLNHLYQNLIFLNFYQGKGVIQKLDMQGLVERRLEYFSALFAQKSLTITKDLSPAFLYANYDEIVILLDNLLSNAMKYNKKGGSISIQLCKLESTFELIIADSGCGLEPSEIEQIFTRYTRYHASQGGFGIGLCLVKEIATRYGIGIRVESEKGKGSAFILSWQQLLQRCG